ncbi:ATP phosphoribosyltransferase regulatory subunit [Anaerobacillus alkaliphilus]|uniref:ATP phosphoribosyltransferase regulatory subunit n=1 Tax=Anaerobacillus alkaliphilus TaxID=1548597 RepID=A0A4Q0VTX4_9BACI|nr:ATP phosphoribosyltransferase regulatory subunit [Anaerobacillus alkaliphilus]RXJ01729.1 ATP phosphoribosyltransferase regulatory subunit [Anaerobacillus alkaliphilus]
MTKPFMFEKPIGMRDTLPNLYEAKQKIRQGMTEEVKLWGYQPIETPTLEYYETVGVASAILDQQLFKLLDQRGNTLVLRPDMTAPIARLAASSLKDVSTPLRLAYDANVYRAQHDEGGRPAEFEQIGVELIGDASNSADGEVIALMIATLKKAGLTHFKIAIGHVGYVNALLLEIVGNEQRTDTLRRFLYEKNYVGYRQHVKSLPLSSIDKTRLLQLLNLRGEFSKLAEAKELVTTEKGIKAVQELEKLLGVLDCYGITDFVKLDLNLVMHMSYYTGPVFEAYSDNLGTPIASGGRYDELLQKFNRPAPATGFGIRLDLLIKALGVKGETQPITCIIYSNERRKDAIELAKEKRQEGLAVILQDLSGVKDVDVFSEGFEDIIYCIGKNGKGDN